MIRPATLIWVMLAFFAAGGLYLLKHQTEQTHARLVRVNKDIRANEETIHVLRAEWAYLNDPSRLRELNDRYLAMSPVTAWQMLGLQGLDTPKIEAAREAALKADSKNAKRPAKALVAATEVPKAPPVAHAPAAKAPAASSPAKPSAPIPSARAAEPLGAAHSPSKKTTAGAAPLSSERLASVR